MKHYCLGFIFDPLGNVVLIEKQKPEWQKGLLNGIGGKVEPGEDYTLTSIIRECKEETGLIITDWTYVCHMERPKDFSMGVYATMIDDVYQAVTQEEEKLVHIHHSLIYEYNAVENIYWLLPFAWHQLLYPSLLKAPNFNYR